MALPNSEVRRARRDKLVAGESRHMQYQSVHVQEKILFEEFAGGFKAAHVLPRMIRDVHANFELNWPDRLAAKL